MASGKVYDWVIAFNSNNKTGYIRDVIVSLDSKYPGQYSPMLLSDMLLHAVSYESANRLELSGSGWELYGWGGMSDLLTL